MIFLNILMFLRSVIAVPMNVLQGMNEVEISYLTFIHTNYLENGFKHKHIDVKLATDNWIEMCEKNKMVDEKHVTSMIMIPEINPRFSEERHNVSTSGPDGLYNYFSDNVPEFKQLLEQELKQENTNKEDLKNAVKSYMIKDKVPEILKKEIEHVMDNNMNSEEAEDYLTKKNSEFNTFLNINGICKGFNQDPEDCEIYFIFNGTYLDGDRFFYTDLIYIKKDGEEVELELIPVFDEDKKEVVSEN